MHILPDLFITFAKVGVCTFGGGYAMLPVLSREVCENKHWVSEEEISDLYAIGQCTPGVIAVNVSTAVGFKHAGILGGIIATLGVVFPSVVIITLIAAFISNFADLAIVKNAFAGIRVCVLVLVINTIIKLWKSAITNKFSIAVFAIVFVLAVFTGFSAALIVIAAGLAGLAWSFIRKRRASE